MKKILKIIGVALAVALIAVPSAYAAKPLKEAISTYASDEGVYMTTIDGADLTVDKKTLNFSLTKDGRTWYSGRRVSDDDGLANNAILRNKLVDGVTVAYRTVTNKGLSNSTTEEALSDLNAAVTFTERADGFDAKIYSNKIQLGFTLQWRYANGKITLTVPSDSFVESPDKSLVQHIILYPFFDSSYSLVDGQIFIPDGSGAVIDLSKQTSAKRAYSARVYGADYGITFNSVSSTSPQTATLPLLALTYPDGGTMLTADGGAEYCSVNAQVSGITTNYNAAYFTWIYRESYVKYYGSNGADDAGKSYAAFQDERNDFDLKQTITLFNGPTTMADIAREYGKTIDVKQNETPNATGLKLNFLMSENKQGMFGKEVVVMTTAEYVGQVVNEVSAFCGNLSVGLIGYTDGGLDGSYPSHFPLETKTGSKRDYRNLAANLKEKGVSLAFNTDFMRAYENASVSDSKLVLNISEQFINVSDSRSGSSARYNLLTLNGLTSQMSKDIDKMSRYSTVVDFQSIGSMLYSGYNKGEAFTRSKAIETLVNAVKNANVTANLYKPNAYMYGVIDGYLDAPLSSSGYIIATESVPMVQMILSGKVPMYSSAVNLNYTGKELILRLIDYNVYPSFTLTEQDAIELYGTNSSGLFTSSYAIWKDDVKAVYEHVSGVLDNVRGASVVNRYSPANGVYVTTYSNGVSVIVNYTNSPATVGNVTVPALSGVSATINN